MFPALSLCQENRCPEAIELLFECMFSKIESEDLIYYKRALTNYAGDIEVSSNDT